jgi:carbon monoxide dehydrogenase subunit G
MDLIGDQRISAPRQKVWEALNDPAVLSACIPGCQSLEKEADDRFNAIAEVRIGPIGARFKGAVELSEIDAPNGYVIRGKGNGGIAGSASGTARVRLAEENGGTLLTYSVYAEVGGRMAQLGGPIIDATARNLAGKFFGKFGEVVTGSGAAPVTEAQRAPALPGADPVAISAAPTAMPSEASSLWAWVAAIVAAILTGYFLGLNASSGGVVAVVMVLLVIVAAAAFEAGRRGTRT